MTSKRLKSKPEQVYEYCLSGGSIPHAARKFKVNNRTVRKYCRDYGLDFREGIKLSPKTTPEKMTEAARTEARDTVRSLRATIAIKSKYYEEQTKKDAAFAIDGREVLAMKNMATTIRLTLDAYPGIMELEEEEESSAEPGATDDERSKRQHAALMGVKPDGEG